MNAATADELLRAPPGIGDKAAPPRRRLWPGRGVILVGVVLLGSDFVTRLLACRC